jgi:SAM-dependent methyltransferase
VLDVGRRQYAERWSGNAAAYEAQGLYLRLAEHLASFGKFSRIIDIGCGLGEGLVALRQITGETASLLIGLDENPDCLEAATQRLRIDCPRNRLRRVSRFGRKYDLKFVAGRLPQLAPIVLVQTDLRRPDPELDALVGTASPYDAVTIWFTGIHPAREHDQIVNSLEITSDRVHRMATDLAALEYACAFVRPGGYLHVVSRFAGNQPTSLQAIAEAEMQALAEHGSVELVEVLLVPYQEPVSNLRIGVAAADLSGDAETFAGSAIFRIVLPS